MLDQSQDGSTCSSLGELLNEQWDESDPEDQEDRDDTSLDPSEDGLQIVTSRLTWKDVAVAVVMTDPELLVECTEEDEGKHEDLNRAHDEDVVDVETRVTIVESQESIDRKLGTEVVVFSR